MSSHLPSGFALAPGVPGSACPLGRLLQAGEPSEKMFSVQTFRAGLRAHCASALRAAVSAAPTSWLSVCRAEEPRAGPLGLLVADMFEPASSCHQRSCLSL